MRNRLTVGGSATPLKISIKRFLNQSKEQPDTPPPNDGNAIISKVCQKVGRGTGYKVNKNTKGKVISKCLKCQNHVCGKHRYLVCRICKEMK